MISLDRFEEEVKSFFGKDFLSPVRFTTSNFTESFSSQKINDLFKQDFKTFKAILFFLSLVPPNSSKFKRYKAIDTFLKTTYSGVPDNKLYELRDLLLKITDYFSPNEGKRSIPNEVIRALLYTNKANSSDGLNYCESCGFRLIKEHKINDSTIVDILKPHYFRKYKRYRNVEVDHIFPFSISKNNDINNLQVLCGFCNEAKSNKLNIFQYSNDFFEKEKKGQDGVFFKNYKIPKNWVVFRAVYKSHCVVCHAKSDERELSVDIENINRQPTLDNLVCKCYKCIWKGESIKGRFVSNLQFSKIFSLYS